MITPTMTVSIEKGDRLEKIFADVRALDTVIATAGISRHTPPHPIFGNGSRSPVGFVNTAELASVHEYGGSLPSDDNKSPARPFIGPTFDALLPENATAMADIVGKVIDGAHGTGLLLKLATMNAEATKVRIKGFIGPELAARTKGNRMRRSAYYGSAKATRGAASAAPFTPIMDGGQIYHSIRGEVDTKVRFGK